VPIFCRLPSNGPSLGWRLFDRPAKIFVLSSFPLAPTLCLCRQPYASEGWFSFFLSPKTVGGLRQPPPRRPSLFILKAFWRLCLDFAPPSHKSNRFFFFGCASGPHLWLFCVYPHSYIEVVYSLDRSSSSCFFLHDIVLPCSPFLAFALAISGALGPRYLFPRDVCLSAEDGVPPPLSPPGITFFFHRLFPFLRNFRASKKAIFPLPIVYFLDPFNRLDRQWFRYVFPLS